MISSLTSSPFGQLSMSFMFFGIAVTATALFVYNLKMYLDIRRSTIISKKEDRIEQADRFACERSARISSVVRRASVTSKEVQQLQDALPHGWEKGITSDGFVYYINHFEQTTSWDPPPASAYGKSPSKSSRKQVSDKDKEREKAKRKHRKSDKDKERERRSILRTFSASDFTTSSKKKAASSVSSSSSPSIALSSLEPLPARCQSETNLKALSKASALPTGWEEAYTPDGLAYYINHHDATTTWIDPRTLKSQKGTQTMVTAAQACLAAEEEEQGKFLEVIKSHSREDSGYLSRNNSHEDVTVLQARLEALMA